MNTRGIVAGALLLGALGACTQSKIDPNARVQITGSLRRQSGTAVSGARLALAKGPDIIDVISTVTSLGLACLTDEVPHACNDARLTQTNSDGGFDYQLRGRDTQGFFGNASTLELSGHLARAGEQLDGPAVTMRFQVQTTRLNLPLRFWEPSLKLTGSRNEVAASWSQVPANILPPQASLANIRTSVRFTRGTERVWTYALAGSGARLDPRFLEDSSGSAAVIAEERGINVGESFGRRIDVVWRSARFPYLSPIGAPVSRGAACFVTDARRHPIEQSNCRLTNGVFGDALDPRTVASGPEPPHRAAYLDLKRPTWITLVVIRGCDGRCAVQVSDNAKRWHTVGSGASGQRFVGVAPAGRVRARYVRVRSDGDLSTLNEVSVWDRTRPRPATAASGKSLITSLSAAGQSPLTDGGGGGAPWKIIVIVLVVVGIAGGAFMLGRARRAPSAG